MKNSLVKRQLNAIVLQAMDELKYKSKMTLTEIDNYKSSIDKADKQATAIAFLVLELLAKKIQQIK